MSLFIESVRGIAKDSASLFWSLLKVMLPVMVAVKVAQDLGWVEQLAHWLSPLMVIVGLPEQAGLVWVTALLVNIYGGAAVFIGLLPNLELTVADATVLWSMVLIAHALPVEQRIAQQAGASFWLTAALRFFGALFYGALLNAIYTAGDWLQQPLSLSWLPQLDGNQDTTWLDWAWSNIQSLFWVFVIIVVLLVVLKVFDLLKITDLLSKLITPVLRVMGIEGRATTLTMFGTLLGLTYGGALIIKEARAGHVAKKDIVLSLCFMSLCHSLIEDTLFVMALGADASGVLIGRFIFSVIVVALIAACYRRWSPDPVSAHAGPHTGNSPGTQ